MRLHNRFDRQRGQAVILVVVAMSILLIGVIGLAVDGAQMYAQRQMAQAAADSAAQAGIMSIYTGTNATSAHPFGTGSTPIASSACTTSDLRTPCVYARYNGFGGTATDTVTLSYPATVSGVTLSPANVPAFTVTVQRTLKTGLIRFVGGAATTSVTAKATAGLVGTVSPSCIYVLNPSAPSAFLANNGATITVSGCAVAVDSSSGSAVSISGGATVTASAINVVGGTSINNGGSASPTPVTGVAAVADPFVTLPSPAVGSCASHPSTFYPGTGSTVTPGTYCGGINVSNGATNITFAPGTYIINGGGIGFNSGTITGSGVMFYLTGTNSSYGSVTIANGASTTLTAQTSGTYMGVLFYQNRSITSSNDATFAGGATMQLSGTLYFPTTSVSFSNGTSTAGYNTAIVADQVSFAGGANIQYDSTGLKTGLFTKAVALVQ